MGSGFALDSVKSLSYNRLLKKFRHTRYNEMRNAVNKIRAKYHRFRDHSNLTTEQRKQYKNKIKKSIRIQKQKSLLFSSIFTIIIFISMIIISKYLYYYFINSF